MSIKSIIGGMFNKEKGKILYNKDKPFCPYGLKAETTRGGVKIQIGSEKCKECKFYIGGNDKWTNCKQMIKTRGDRISRERSES